MIFLYVILLSSLVCGTFVLTILVGRQRFSALVTREVARVLSDAAVDLGPEQLAARWDSLPEPVRRYLCYAVPDGMAGIRTVRLTHRWLLSHEAKPAVVPNTGRGIFLRRPPGVRLERNRLAGTTPLDPSPRPPLARPVEHACDVLLDLQDRRC